VVTDLNVCRPTTGGGTKRRSSACIWSPGRRGA